MSGDRAAVSAWLAARAKSYGHDAMTLSANGDTENALLYMAIRDELRAARTWLLADTALPRSDEVHS